MPKGKPTATKGGLAKVIVDVPSEGDSYPAKLTGIEVVKASDVFKDKAKDPDRPTLSMTFEGPGGVKGTANLSAPGITPDGHVVARNPKSNLFKYMKMYKKGPHVGQDVEVTIDANGFYRLRIE